MSSDATVPRVRYLDPVYHELAQLRTDNARMMLALDQAEERIDNLSDALDRRTATQNATGEANDALVRRAIAAERTLELVAALESHWSDIGKVILVEDLRAALGVQP
jgi:cell division septum initiation protein DivIVA